MGRGSEFPQAPRAASKRSVGRCAQDESGCGAFSARIIEGTEGGNRFQDGQGSPATQREVVRAVGIAPALRFRPNDRGVSGAERPHRNSAPTKKLAKLRIRCTPAVRRWREFPIARSLPIGLPTSRRQMRIECARINGPQRTGAGWRRAAAAGPASSTLRA